MSSNKELLQERVRQLAESLEPAEAVETLSTALQEVLHKLEEEQRIRFVLNLLGDEDQDKLSSMVHL